MLYTEMSENENIHYNKLYVTFLTNSIIYFTSYTNKGHIAHRKKLLVGVAQVILGL